MTAARDPAIFAAEQYRVRQARAQIMVRNGGMVRTTAERHLRPWLAIACITGAMLPEIEHLLADMRACEGAGPHMMSPGALRWLAAEEICPRSMWVPVLTGARNTAFDRFVEAGDDASRITAFKLQCICLALQHDVNGDDIPPYVPAALRERAVA